MKREEIIQKLETQTEEIKKLTMYDYLGLDVYSKEYYRNILLNIYDNASQNYAFIYGDFNKVNSINNNISKKAGDIALENSFRIIKETLPADAIVSRIGGDEVTVILPNLSKKEAEEYCKLISQNMKKASESIYGLTITLASTDSSKGNLRKLEEIAESKVSKQKNQRDPLQFESNYFNKENLELRSPKNINTSEKEEWARLNCYINMGIENHLADIRLSENDCYNLKDYKKQKEYVFNNLLKDFSEYLEDCVQNEENKKKSYIKHSSFAANTLDLLFKGKASLDGLSNTQLLEIEKLVEHILKVSIRNRDNSLFNKSYFKNFLADKIIEKRVEFQPVFISSTGLKISNTAYGHIFTDERMKNTTNTIKSEFEKIYEFKDEPFLFSQNIPYFIDYGGGNYLLLCPKNQNISKENLDKIVENINSKYLFTEKKSNFKIVATTHENIKNTSKEEMYEHIEKLNDICNNKKKNIKMAGLDSICASIAFENSMNLAVRYFVNNIPNAKDDLQKRQYFVYNVFASLLNQEANHNNRAIEKQMDNSR